MWKILVAFIVFAAIALTVVFKAGDKADMQGEAGGHNSEQTAAPAAAPAQPAATEAAAPSAPATTVAPAEEKK